MNNGRQGFQATGSSSTSSSTDSLVGPSTTYQGTTKDDSYIPSQRSTQIPPRPLSAIELNSPIHSPAASPKNTAKPSPDRYRRNPSHHAPNTTLTTHQQGGAGSASPSGSGMATVGHLYNPPTQHSSTPTIAPSTTYRASQMSSNVSGPGFHTQHRMRSMDDMTVYRQSSSEQAKRYRRRSVSSLEAKDMTGQFSDAQEPVFDHPANGFPATQAPQIHDQHESRSSALSSRPGSVHDRSGSADSVSSTRSNQRPSSVSFPP